jgi:hypothetical protein
MFAHTVRAPRRPSRRTAIRTPRSGSLHSRRSPRPADGASSSRARRSVRPSIPSRPIIRGWSSFPTPHTTCPTIGSRAFFRRSRRTCGSPASSPFSLASTARGRAAGAHPRHAASPRQRPGLPRAIRLVSTRRPFASRSSAASWRTATATTSPPLHPAPPRSSRRRPFRLYLSVARRHIERVGRHRARRDARDFVFHGHQRRLLRR